MGKIANVETFNKAAIKKESLAESLSSFMEEIVHDLKKDEKLEELGFKDARNSNYKEIILSARRWTTEVHYSVSFYIYGTIISIRSGWERDTDNFVEYKLLRFFPRSLIKWHIKKALRKVIVKENSIMENDLNFIREKIFIWIGI